MSSLVLLVAVAAACLLVVSLGILAVDRLESENEILEAEIESSHMYQEALGQRIEQVRRYRHDADGLLRAIEHALHRSETSSVDEGERIAGEDEYPELWDGAYPLVQAAIDLHKRQCVESGIPFLCSIAEDFGRGIADCGMEEAELCIVLQNLLDNAYEANCRIDARVEPRFAPMMSLDARVDGRRLVLEVANRTASSEQPSLRTSKPQRELHGVGLMVVQDVARKHGGTVTASFDADARVMRVVFKL